MSSYTGKPTSWYWDRPVGFQCQWTIKTVTGSSILMAFLPSNDDIIKWKHFPCYWPFVQGIHQWPVNSPYKGQWRGALMFSLICAWTNSWVNNHDACDLRCHHTHYDVTVMGIILGQFGWRTDRSCNKLNRPSFATFLTHWPLGDFNFILGR